LHGFSGPLGLKWGSWGNVGRGGAMSTQTNSFLLLGVLTSVPILVKIDQEMRSRAHGPIHRHTDRCKPVLCCPMLYAIATGQIITESSTSIACFSGTGSKHLSVCLAGGRATRLRRRRTRPASAVRSNCLRISGESVSCTPTTWPASTPESSWLRNSVITRCNGGAGTAAWNPTLRLLTSSTA